MWPGSHHDGLALGCLGGAASMVLPRWCCLDGLPRWCCLDGAASMVLPRWCCLDGLTLGCLGGAATVVLLREPNRAEACSQSRNTLLEFIPGLGILSRSLFPIQEFTAAVYSWTGNTLPRSLFPVHFWKRNVFIIICKSPWQERVLWCVFGHIWCSFFKQITMARRFLWSLFLVNLQQITMAGVFFMYECWAILKP